MEKTIKEFLGDILNEHVGKSGDIIRIYETKRDVEKFFSERNIPFSHIVKKMSGEKRKPGISSYSVAWVEHGKIEMLVCSCLD